MWCKPTNFHSSTGMIWGYMGNIYCSMLPARIRHLVPDRLSRPLTLPDGTLVRDSQHQEAGHKPPRNWSPTQGYFGISCKSQTAVGTLTKHLGNSKANWFQSKSSDISYPFPVNIFQHAGFLLPDLVQRLRFILKRCLRRLSISRAMAWKTCQPFHLEMLDL